MKNIKSFFIVLVAVILIQACDNSSVNGPENINTANDELLKSTIDNLPVEDLSEAEIASLKFLREEEKLARDVYIFLYEKYGQRVFTNISKSEQTHTNAISYLLDKYSLEDPVSEDVRGNFVNEDLQALYNSLIEKGSVSLVEALKVGALIEEVDIVDLQKALDEEVDNQDIVMVYSNLKSGSENHLRAYVRNLSNNGVEYTPVLLDADYYNSVIGK